MESDADQRRRGGFRVGAHHRRASRAVEEREEELVAGFPEHEYIGVVSVSARDLDALDAAANALVQVSAGCGVELRALDGSHADGVAACLPLARGLRQRAVRV